MACKAHKQDLSPPCLKGSISSLWERMGLLEFKMLRCPADRRTSLNRALPSDIKSCLGYSVQPSQSKLSVSQTSKAVISNSRRCHRQRPSHPAVCPTESMHTTPPGAPGCWSQVPGFCLQQAWTCTQLPDCPEVRRIRVNPVSATPESLAVGYTREHARC